MERPGRKERWGNSHKRKLGARSIWDSIHESQVQDFRNMTPEQLIEQWGTYEVEDALFICHEKLASAREAGDQASIDAWEAVAEHLDKWRKEYYRQSQQPSRFSSWAAQSQASRPVYNPRSRF